MWRRVWSGRTTDAEGVENRGAAVEDAADRSVLVVRSRWGGVRVVGEANVAAAVVVDHHAGEVAVAAVHDHPAWAQVRVASTAAVSGPKVVQGCLQVGQ